MLGWCSFCRAPPNDRPLGSCFGPWLFKHKSSGHLSLLGRLAREGGEDGRHRARSSPLRPPNHGFRHTAAEDVQHRETVSHCLRQGVARDHQDPANVEHEVIPGEIAAGKLEAQKHFLGQENFLGLSSQN